MKYNEPIILEENEVHAMLLKKIKPHTKVLEFGAASGRMTKILREQYKCNVYIVEYEEAAFEKAMEYADDGICGDIEKYDWKRWNNEQFDFIFFTDVLEHLKNPQKVLKETYNLLADNGSVLISLPNVGHNDIWIKLFDNKFEYTDIGLLDNTHTHLFAAEALEEFVNGTGYRIVSKQYKTIKTGSTEQCLKEKIAITNDMKSLLLKRKNGEVYQFALELKKEKFAQNIEVSEVEDLYQPLYGWIYFDRGEGFNQDDTEQISGKRISENLYCFEFNSVLDTDVKKIRLDPVENRICRICKCESNLEEPEIPQFRELETKNIIVSYDPQIIWNVTNDNNEVHFEVYVEIDSFENVGLLINDYWNIVNKIEV